MLKRDIRRGQTEMQFQEMRLREEIVTENMKKFMEMDDYYKSVDAYTGHIHRGSDLLDTLVFSCVLVYQSVVMSVCSL